jgi:ATP/maltotriose-dependent transcriptional regulator MalT
MIDAPAGYGKTTLAAQWTAQLDRPVTWLALDEADDDPLRFCTYFVVVMQRVHPAIGDAGIADRLVVSVNTVRFHVKEIYGKLSVNRQAQAVARAWELGVL